MSSYNNLRKYAQSIGSGTTSRAVADQEGKDYYTGLRNNMIFSINEMERSRIGLENLMLDNSKVLRLVARIQKDPEFRALYKDRVVNVITSMINRRNKELAEAI